VLPGDHFYLVPYRDQVIAEVESRLRDLTDRRVGRP
jgi:surfactin synthase thioesterase subunit